MRSEISPSPRPTYERTDCRRQVAGANVEWRFLTRACALGEVEVRVLGEDRRFEAL
jgi:hypothetical protein